MQHATCDMRHATCDMRHATRDMRHATCDMRHATCAGTHKVHSLQLAISQLPQIQLVRFPLGSSTTQLKSYADSRRRRLCVIVLLHKSPLENGKRTDAATRQKLVVNRTSNFFGHVEVVVLLVSRFGQTRCNLDVQKRGAELLTRCRNRSTWIWASISP